MEIEEIYKVYINDVYRYLFSLSRSHHVAEDLMQETFYRAYLYLEDYENQKVKSWLFKVAYHTFIDFVRKRKSNLCRNGGIRDDTSGESTEEYVVAKNSYEKLNQIIHTLPVVEAQAILLCDVHQLTYEEGASVLDLKLNTYKSHIFRGRKRLKELLKEEKSQNDK
ncbi:sigma-70 family RNA polymerase sigma factor [Bacillus wiedmannii]